MEITATVFKNPFDLMKVRQMIESGADILRVKFAHIQHEETVGIVKQIKELIDHLGTNTKILADLPEEKIRLGQLAYGKDEVLPGEMYVLRPSDTSYAIDDFIPVKLTRLDKHFNVGDVVSMGDGELAFQVRDVVSQDKVIIEFLHAGMVDQFRGLMSPYLADNLDHCSTAVSTLNLFREVRPDKISLSFVNCPGYIQKVRNEIKSLYGDSWNPAILAKIESPEGLLNLESIIDAADEVVIARGDLGLVIDFSKIILEQKRACRIGLAKNKPVIVATQILTSCLERSVPLRSELSDLTNIILDGASGIWFSQETSLSQNPGKLIHLAKRIINSVESNRKEYGF